jgi:antibiotic biosynthesis monooxygenase (ABM) superfamily enzyme
MNRRTCLTTAAAVLAAPLGMAAAEPRRGIQLHVDLTVDPAREKEMLKNFHEVFKPAAVKHPGYINVEIVKLRSTLMGKAPGDANYRFILTYESEELRKKWVASPVHIRVWPTIENTLKHKNYTVLLYDNA